MRAEICAYLRAGETRWHEPWNYQKKYVYQFLDRMVGTKYLYWRNSRISTSRRTRTGFKECYPRVTLVILEG